MSFCADGTDNWIERELNTDDCMQILEELLPAQNRSKLLARKLKLQEHTVQTIHNSYTDKTECLCQVILEFLNQVEPRPTWRVILDALRSPVVNLPRLAQDIEKRHGFSTTVNESTLRLGTYTCVFPYFNNKPLQDISSLTKL